MTDPRPAEGPDREALAEAARAAWFGPGDRWLAVVDAVLALLPSPPAPGGVRTYPCCRHCRQDRQHAVPPEGHAIPCDDGCDVPAPGGGDTELRAVIAQALGSAANGDGRAKVDAVLAALAARPDADRDALARVRALCDTWAGLDAYRHHGYTVEQRTLVSASVALRAALARDTEADQ